MDSAGLFEMLVVAGTAMVGAARNEKINTRTVNAVRDLRMADSSEELFPAATGQCIGEHPTALLPGRIAEAQDLTESKDRVTVMIGGGSMRRWLAISIAGIVVASGLALPGAAAPRSVTPPPPACTPNTAATPAQTEGPFYKANTPERTTLIEPTMTGTRVTVTGYVLGRDCRPIARARLDFWQADDRGTYDNAGYRLRGHQFTDSSGVYYLETILPGLYPGRARHIHVKVQPPNGATLTTQLYFPGESQNQTDNIFNRALLVETQQTAAGRVAFFTFVVDVRR